MYNITILTENGPIMTSINNITELESAIAPYQETYIGVQVNKVGATKTPIEQKKEEPKMTKDEVKVKITDYDINWKKIKSACMTTISKEAGDKEPSSEWKRKLLLCEHSPIRRGSISWKWDEIPYAISTHFVRYHEGVEKWVGTERADRTDVKDRSQRSQMNPVPMEMEANIQAIINISYKRLCTCADPTTRKYWEAVILAIKEYDEDIFWACVPQCIRCGGCPEYKPCGFYDKFAEKLTKEEQTNVRMRYDKYNEEREKRLSLKR